MDYDKGRNVGLEEIQRWAETRSDDAGYVSRFFVSQKKEISKNEVSSAAQRAVAKWWHTKEAYNTFGTKFPQNLVGYLTEEIMHTIFKEKQDG